MACRHSVRERIEAVQKRAQSAPGWPAMHGFRQAACRIDYDQRMDFVVDLDPTHLVLRITVTTVLTDKAAKDIYQAVARLALRGGPYAVIADLSQVVNFPRMVRKSDLYEI